MDLLSQNNYPTTKYKVGDIIISRSPKTASILICKVVYVGYMNEVQLGYRLARFNPQNGNNSIFFVSVDKVDNSKEVRLASETEKLLYA